MCKDDIAVREGEPVLPDRKSDCRSCQRGTNLVPLLFMLACAVMMLKYTKGRHGHQAENERTIPSPEAPGAGHVRG